MSQNESTPQSKNVNEEPPQDMVFVRGPGKQLPPVKNADIDWEWEFEERADPGEDAALPWFDRQ